jgi:hypothetical protein
MIVLFIFTFFKVFSVGFGLDPSGRDQSDNFAAVFSLFCVTARTSEAFEISLIVCCKFLFLSVLSLVEDVPKTFLIVLTILTKTLFEVISEVEAEILFEVLIQVEFFSTVINVLETEVSVASFVDLDSIGENVVSEHCCSKYCYF